MMLFQIPLMARKSFDSRIRAASCPRVAEEAFAQRSNKGVEQVVAVAVRRVFVSIRYRRTTLISASRRMGEAWITASNRNFERQSIA
jgi:hypothetical protein